MNSNNVGADSLTIPIHKLMLWRGSWTKYDSKVCNSFLRIHYDQLLITVDAKILESINMRHKIKGIFKEDVLVLIISNSCTEIRKIKFQIKSNVPQCLQMLGEHFPVINHKTKQCSNFINAKYRNINDVLKYAMEHKDDAATLNISPVSSNFVKLCLLDPLFPQIVSQVEKIIKDEITKN